ncbi:hypothetical protein CCP4SC76_2260001 [Gammaproteobacteria bacterium]
MSITLNPHNVLTFPLTGVHLIEASAGTGKTYTIANLYLLHIINGQPVGNLLVVTFTVAATDELRGRIRAKLAETLEILEAAKSTTDVFLAALVEDIRRRGQAYRGDIIKLLRLAVRTMDEAAIFTIHGFCQRALTEFAFNSGQPFQMEVLTDDTNLWRQSIQDWWRRTSYPLTKTHLQIFTSAKRMQSLGSFLELLGSLLGPQPKQLIPAGASSVSAILTGHAHSSLLEVTALADAEKFAKDEVRKAKQKAQVLSFDDLLTETWDALQSKNGDDLANAIRKQFPVAMIDEFQDTDPVQYEIFSTLYCKQPKHGLTMIGDPKQAIYSFRGGDIFTGRIPDFPSHGRTGMIDGFAMLFSKFHRPALK